MSIAEEAIGQIENADEAGMVAARIMAHFGLAGTVFGPEDVRNQLEGNDMTEVEVRHEVDTYMKSTDWKYISDRTTELANGLIADDMVARMGKN